MGQKEEIDFNPIKIELSGGLSAIDRIFCDPYCPQYDGFMMCKAFNKRLSFESREEGPTLIQRCKKCQEFEDEFKKRGL